MSKYSVEEAFNALNQVLESNAQAETKDFWAIYFHWWRFFYSINQNLEKSPVFSDKIAQIEQFMKYSRELSKIETHILERSKIPKEKLIAVEIIPFAPHIQNIQALLKKEQDRFSKLMKEVKKGKNPISIKRRSSRQKWLRS